MSTLGLSARRGAHTAEPRADGYRLCGEVDWLLAGSACDLALAVEDLRGVCEPLSDGIALLSFGNTVGYFAVRGLGMVEVVSGKWERGDFERMLAEITDVAAGLPFAAGTSAALPYDRSVVTRQDVLYHHFVYLRHIPSDTAPRSRQLMPALRAVLQTPHQRFTRMRESVPLDRVRRMDAASVARLVQGRDQLAPAPAWLQATLPVTRLLRGHVPERLDEGRIETTHDTAENRFIKSFLGTAEAIIASTAEAAQKRMRQDAFSSRLLGDCERMARALGLIANHRFWREIGSMVQLPASSPVLQQRHGYREVYEHFVRMRLAARIPLSEDLVRDLLEARDIAQLYELWSYFVLVREVTHLRGAPIRADGPQVDPWGVSMRWDMAVAWADGTRLLYNPRFSRSRPDNRRSYSVPLRPDIALEVPSGQNAGLHLFDAKFRLESIGALMPADSADDETSEAISEERRGTFKRGDLYKMHAYRDAIAAARSVWILYPGSEFRFYSSGGGLLTSPAQADLGPFDGVGAVPLVKTDDSQAPLKMVLTNLLPWG